MNITITSIENGPLILQASEAVEFDDSITLEADKPVYLCRCGASTNKPFCDGKHSAAGFSSNRDISEEIQQHYPGDPVTIDFNRSICTGAANCVRDFPSVFKTDNSENWIFPENGSTEEIAKAVASCPSGAISYAVKDQVIIESIADVGMSIDKDGPYLVQGIELNPSDSKPAFTERKYSLCRCGHSRN